ncbi:hypothetical protein CAEBREN_06358 [Caenorhabditis brenneri]|uniref:Uncharacterized protein n=1 Tax=Caenorhabditis brenneri TaxID=135651 RepID=G0P022_CAEBE|nr:hypothetical protein CAEBREN_06358 [Caenorhabditis brenneri]
MSASHETVPEKQEIQAHEKRQGSQGSNRRLSPCPQKLRQTPSADNQQEVLPSFEDIGGITNLALVEKYRFTQVLAKSMTPVRLEIKKKAYSEFKDFLENIKKGRIGKHVKKDTAEQHSFGVTGDNVGNLGR